MTEFGTGDTIVAIATAPGRGGIGVLRLSGPRAAHVATTIAPPLPAPRRAELRFFHAVNGEAIDRGLVLYFPAPGSYTGEEVVELQAHGSPAVLDELLSAAQAAGARLARPGEFTERAFVNGRMDLAQVGAVADLIEADSRAAARAAFATLEGRFSDRLRPLAQALLACRARTEALLDFPEDEVPEEYVVVRREVAEIRSRFEALEDIAARGRRLIEGYVCVLVGAPNVGKSSLFNALNGSERAIVTEIPGTTRDLIEAEVVIDGLRIRLVDTAGLRQGGGGDPVELEGGRRARARALRADRVIEVRAGTEPGGGEEIAPGVPRLLVLNKIDLGDGIAGEREVGGEPAIAVSAKTGAGLDVLIARLRECALGESSNSAGARFVVQRYQLEILGRVCELLAQAESQVAPELLAEDLARAQRAVGEITGESSSEELLGVIFSRFCIGK